MCVVIMNKMSLGSIYGNMVTKRPSFSEIAEKLESELSKEIYGCVTCRISEFRNNILVYIDFDRYSYRIDVPVDYSPYRDTNISVSQLVEYVSKRYFDMVYRERFRV